jgi:hypothetical protein
MLKRLVTLFPWLAVAALVTGCAHPISLSPNLANLDNAAAVRIDKKIGLSISAEDRQREVTTPGGGGDKVSYLPYRDLEPGLYYALSKSFADVSKVNGLSDPQIKAGGLHYVLKPSIATTSWSQSVLTWPPTLFTVELSGTIVDIEGRAITELKVQGEGRAEFDEFKSDFSLAAKRASEDALKKLMKAVTDIAAKLR